jgi:CBS domain-containing protein
MKIREIMSKEVVAVTPETPFKSIVERLVQSDVSGLPVIDASGRLVGIVTEADLASKEAYGVRRRRALSVLADVLAGPEWLSKAFGSVASDVMTREVLTCGPDDDVRVATRRMLERRVKRMPVVDDGTVIGMVSRQDILRRLVRPDAEIDADVATVLSSDPNRPDDAHVEHSVHDGVVTLTGDVRYAWDEPAVVSLVRNVDGVIDVISQVHNREPNPRPGSPWMFGVR